MGTRKKWHKTPIRGVRYREHPTRKHGVRRDRYYAIRYQRKGIRIEEGLGFESDGWTLEKAVKELQLLRENATTGEGPQRLREKRQLEDERRRKEALKKLTFGEVFVGIYEPSASDGRKPNTNRTERILYDHFLSPAIGNIPILELGPIQMQKIKQAMSAKAPATVRHALGIVRQTWNVARKRGIVSGDSPTSKITKPKVDNARLRYLTPGETAVLLEALLKRSRQVHDEALLSIRCGLRFGEIAGLKAEDVNFATGTLAIRDAKAGSGVVFVGVEIASMLRLRIAEHGRGLLFPARNGQRQQTVSKTFTRVADTLFNRDMTDPRLRVTFHTLRHTFATMLYEKTADVYLVQKALRHRTITMSQRYAKMSESRLREAFVAMENIGTSKGGEEKAATKA